MNDDRPNEPSPAAPPGGPDDSTDFVVVSETEQVVFDALWSGVINGWESVERHQRFIEHARLAGMFLEAAKRYGALRDDLERGAVAKKQLSTIALLATNELLATRSPPPSKRAPTWLVVVAVVVCVSLLATVFYWAWPMTKP